jgi:two-component system sensor histidine kinase DesK
MASYGLVYLIFPLASITHHSGWTVVAALVCLAAFVGNYLTIFATSGPWSEPPRVITWVLLATLTASATALSFAFGAEWVGLFIYVAIAGAMTVPITWVQRGVGAVTVLTLAVAALSGTRGSALAFVVVATASLGFFQMAFRNSRMLNIELQKTRAEVARLAATDERLRISRDLHDLLGHSLSLIVLKAELARRIGSRDLDRTTQELGDIESVARQALKDARAAVSGYRQRSLIDEVDSARAVLAAAEVEAVVRIADTPLPEVTDRLLGWAVREGVTNVVRHARAARCEIDIRRDGDSAVLEIVDNGQAMPAAPGNGLTGLTERIEAGGGSIAAGPRESGGFRLTVRAPLGQPSVTA